MRDIPDILGMELSAATALLEAEGLAFIVIETKPTKKVPEDGILRVIKIQHSKDLVLTVCRI